MFRLRHTAALFLRVRPGEDYRYQLRAWVNLVINALSVPFEFAVFVVAVIGAFQVRSHLVVYWGYGRRPLAKSQNHRIKLGTQSRFSPPFRHDPGGLGIYLQVVLVFDLRRDFASCEFSVVFLQLPSTLVTF